MLYTKQGFFKDNIDTIDNFGEKTSLYMRRLLKVLIFIQSSKLQMNTCINMQNLTIVLGVPTRNNS